MKPVMTFGSMISKPGVFTTIHNSCPIWGEMNQSGTNTTGIFKGGKKEKKSDGSF